MNTTKSNSRRIIGDGPDEMKPVFVVWLERVNKDDEQNEETVCALDKKLIHAQIMDVLVEPRIAGGVWREILPGEWVVTQRRWRSFDKPGIFTSVLILTIKQP